MRELFDKIKIVEFPKNQYIEQVHDKKQIYLHHTASGKGIKGDVEHWLGNRARVATCVIIGWDGKIHQCFSSKYWGHHLGIKIDVFRKHGIDLFLREYSSGKKYWGNNEKLNQESIAIEIDSWGPLTKKGNRYFSWAGTEVLRESVIFYHDKFKGHHYYEKYTPEQIESTRLLLTYWGKKYGIPLHYLKHDMWDVSVKALSGDPGVYTHNSVRIDKTDIHPDPQIIQMLKTL